MKRWSGVLIGIAGLAMIGGAVYSMTGSIRPFLEVVGALGGAVIFCLGVALAATP